MVSSTGDAPDPDCFEICNGIIRSERYRAWIDDHNTGHVKILRRINFVTLVTILRHITTMQKKGEKSPRNIRIYIPGSLQTIYSDNLRSVIEFAEFCFNLKIIVIISDDVKDPVYNS
jgi:hypothetical protein